jgi:hypothetical protein
MPIGAAQAGAIPVIAVATAIANIDSFLTSFSFQSDDRECGSPLERLLNAKWSVQ